MMTKEKFIQANARIFLDAKRANMRQIQNYFENCIRNGDPWAPGENAILYVRNKEIVAGSFDANDFVFENQIVAWFAEHGFQAFCKSGRVFVSDPMTTQAALEACDDYTCKY